MHDSVAVSELYRTAEKGSDIDVANALKMIESVAVHNDTEADRTLRVLGDESAAPVVYGLSSSPYFVAK